MNFNDSKINLFSEVVHFWEIARLYHCFVTSARLFQSQKITKMQRRRIRQRRRFYNRNHLVKSRYGVHPVGYRVRRKRFNWRGNRGHRNLRRELQADQHLMAVIGVERAPVGQIVRLTWDYIRNSNLQNPLNRRMIRPDLDLGSCQIFCDRTCFWEFVTF